MKKIWFDEAWQDYLWWQEHNGKTLRRINLLIQDIERGGYGGIGKLETLKRNLAGFWSRRIDEENRLVYRIRQGVLEIVSCKGHYD